MKKKLRTTGTSSIRRPSNTSRQTPALDPNRKLSHYEERVLVTSRLPHATVTKDPNPFCPACKWRTYPQWGTHECRRKGSGLTEQQLQRIRHVAGDMLSTLHFYRHHPEEQVASLALALTYALGRNTPRRYALKRWRAIMPKMEKLIRREAGGNAEGIVAAINFGPMKIKKRRQR